MSDKAQLSPAPLTTQGQSWCLRSPADKSCPEHWAFPMPVLADGRNLAAGQRELSMNDKIIVLPGCVKAHTQGLCFHPVGLLPMKNSSWNKQLSLVSLLTGCKTFSKSLCLSCPPLRTWETPAFSARPMADGMRLLLRGNAPPLPGHVPKQNPSPCTQAVISPS